MKEVFDYINGNSFLATIIGVVVGWILNNISKAKERKELKKEEMCRERRRQYENKPELRIVNVLEKSDNKSDIEVFLAPFQVNYQNGFKNYEFIYPKDITNKQKHKYKEFHIKNIGLSDINQLDICANFKNHNLLVNYDMLNYIVKNKSIEYNYCYDRKILKGEFIVIRVYFLEEYQMCHPFSCTLSILFQDSYDNLWEQPFWYEKDNLYQPRGITVQEYHRSVTMNDALECFEKPWLW